MDTPVVVCFIVLTIILLLGTFDMIFYMKFADPVKIKELTFNRNQMKFLCDSGNCDPKSVPDFIRCVQTKPYNWECDFGGYKRIKCLRRDGYNDTIDGIPNRVFVRVDPNQCYLVLQLESLVGPPQLAQEIWDLLGYHTVHNVTVDGVLYVNPHYINTDFNCMSPRFYNHDRTESLPNPNYIDFTLPEHRTLQVVCDKDTGACCSNPYWTPYHCNGGSTLPSYHVLTCQHGVSSDKEYKGLTARQWAERPAGFSLYALLMKEVIACNSARHHLNACTTEEFDKKREEAYQLLRDGEPNDSFAHPRAYQYVELFKILASYNIGATGPGNIFHHNATAVAEDWIKEQLSQAHRAYKDATKIKTVFPRVAKLLEKPIVLTPEQKQRLEKTRYMYWPLWVFCFYLWGLPGVIVASVLWIITNLYFL